MLEITGFCGCVGRDCLQEPFLLTGSTFLFTTLPFFHSTVQKEVIAKDSVES